uniref:Uncharacterized protein n=1 Tax=uncultured marine virus TaxID=186617 RepID=A0A0F7L6F5_9VIRU|nr:hypothetical protein [uncultured marine virus]
MPIVAADPEHSPHQSSGASEKSSAAATSGSVGRQAAHHSRATPPTSRSLAGLTPAEISPSKMPAPHSSTRRPTDHGRGRGRAGHATSSGQQARRAPADLTHAAAWPICLRSFSVRIIARAAIGRGATRVTSTPVRLTVGAVGMGQSSIGC